MQVHCSDNKPEQAQFNLSSTPVLDLMPWVCGPFGIYGVVVKTIQTKTETRPRLKGVKTMAHSDFYDILTNHSCYVCLPGGYQAVFGSIISPTEGNSLLEHHTYFIY